jgi:hypothetical protein
VEDFRSKGSGPAGFLIKLATGDIRGPNPTARSAAENPEKWYTVDSPFRQLINAIALNELMPLMQQFIRFYPLNGKLYHTSGDP